MNKDLYRIDRNQNPLKIYAKVAVGVLRDSRKFPGHSSRGHLCGISAFLLFFWLGNRLQKAFIIL